MAILINGLSRTYAVRNKWIGKSVGPPKMSLRKIVVIIIKYRFSFTINSTYSIFLMPDRE